LLLFGFGGGYWGHRRYDGAPWAGPGFGIGAVIIVILVLCLLGAFGGTGLHLHF
jgi:hypothetical protein